MPRRLLVLLLALVPSAAAAADRRPPNVVLIVADDLGGRDLGCYGSTYHKTPHLDQLAKDGAKFTDFYGACPVCSPTRASILTGRYPQRANITTFLPGRPDRPDQKLKHPVINFQLPPEEVTLAEALKAAGYATGHFGKWHLGNEKSGPAQQGFDVVVPGTPPDESATDRLTAAAVEFIAANRARPFFVYLPYYAPHIPLKAKPELAAKYQGTPQGGRQSNPKYAAILEDLDAGVGRVVRQLADLKLTDDTVVIFTSDNGGLAVLEGPDTPATSNAPFREGKGFLYEGGVRVPLIVKYPGVVKPGMVTGGVGCSIDFFPTIQDLAGLDRKVGGSSHLDGVSLLPALKGGKVERPADALFWHMPHYTNQGGKPGGAVRAGNFKLVEFYEDGRRELFDVAADPSESRNLIAEKKAIADNLTARLADWRKAVGAKMPTPNPDYRPNPPAEDCTITLHARTAAVHGVQLRFEPLPHKNTLGFWVVKDDWAAFEFTAEAAGDYTVEVLQGCGKGSGGAEVELAVGDSKLTFTVKDTGGFQAFEARAVGTLTIDKPGRHTLTVKAKTKPGVAVMDLRQVVLKPKA